MFSLEQVVRTIVLLLVAGAIFWLLNFLISRIPLLEPYREVARTVLLVLGVLFLIGLLLNFAGYPIVRL
jgi:preprotein translocase subunit SecE